MYHQLGKHMVLVDNGSVIAQPVLPCQTLRFSENRYFAGGWNQAMEKLSRYDWVAMLNSDVVGINLAMIEALAEQAEAAGVAVLSPSFNSPHAHMHKQGTGVRCVNWIDWCCPLVSTAMWQHVGGFDYPTFVGYGADLDFCKRAAKLSYHFAVSDDHEVIHLGSITALGEGLQGKQGNVSNMNDALKTKWGVNSWTEMF